MKNAHVEATAGIYAIHNIKTNEYYIGQSVDMFHRWKTHKTKLRNHTHDNDKLQVAWDTYGEASFTITTLYTFTIHPFHIIQEVREFLTKKEQYWINKYIKENKVLYNAVLEPIKSCWPSTIESRAKTSLKVRGDKNAQAKLTEQQAIDILTLDKHLSTKEVAAKYGVTVSCIKDLRLRRSWPHLELPKTLSEKFHKISDETKELLKQDLINQTICNDELCQKYNVSLSVVMVMKKKLGISSVKTPKILKVSDRPSWNKGLRCEYAAGANNPNVKLDEDKVREIKELLKQKKSCMSIGKLYNVSNVTIANIRDEKIWVHVK